MWELFLIPATDYDKCLNALGPGGINLFRPVSSILWENSHECIIIIRGAFLSHNKRTNAQIAYRYGEISLRLKIMQLRQNVDYSHLQGTFAIITKKSEILRSLPLLPFARAAPARSRG